MEKGNIPRRANSVEVNKMRAQCYDGAANMAGEYRGVQARIKEVVPGAVYTHCKAHNLNLSIIHACKEPLFRNVMNTLQEIATAESYREFHTSGSFLSSFSCLKITLDSSAATKRSHSFFL
jgi:hypothetical protein